MLYGYDKEIRGVRFLAGVDEAGRGPLAGSVYAAAVILPEEPIEGINDSKKLTEKKREFLYDIIIEKAVSYCIAIATPEEIDELNILQASLLAMRRAVAGLDHYPDYLLVDGNADPYCDVETRLVVKGDATSASIAAASILAKVARDRYMLAEGEKCPEYEFHRHKGYPTKLHYEKLDEHGPSPIHRKSFLKKWEAKRRGSL